MYADVFPLFGQLGLFTLGLAFVMMVAIALATEALRRLMSAPRRRIVARPRARRLGHPRMPPSLRLRRGV